MDGSLATAAELLGRLIFRGGRAIFFIRDSQVLAPGGCHLVTELLELPM